MRQKISLFPTLIYQSKIRLSASHKKEIFSSLRELEKMDKLGKEWSEQNYLGGYTSYGSATDLWMRYPSLEKLKSQIDEHKNKYIKDLGWHANKSSIEMSSFWVNVMRKGTHHSFHIHPLSVISGTFFLQCPPGSSPFKVQDPRSSAFMARPPILAESKQQSIHNIYPEEGSLLLFESWMPHEVPASKISKERISLSFNYNWNP